jgi:two-component system sensor histidine kinase KdpD
VIGAAIDDLHLPADSFSLQVSDGMPFINADAAQLERAFANLFENSARHANGQPVIVRAWALHNRILMRIVDRGPGIPPAQRERVFEPFYRGRGDGVGGTGLGLAIARGFVEANAGTLTIDDAPGGGTCMRIVLPSLKISEEVPA